MISISVTLLLDICVIRLVSTTMGSHREVIILLEESLPGDPSENSRLGSLVFGSLHVELGKAVIEVAQEFIACHVFDSIVHLCHLILVACVALVVIFLVQIYFLPVLYDSWIVVLQ